LNVLLIVVDDLRPEFNRSYGQSHVKTPFLDSFAKDSLTFSRAYTQYSHCSPSRNSFLSGRSPQTTGVYNFIDDFRHSPSPDSETWVTLTEHFKHHGYWTVGAGKVFHPDRPKNNDFPKSWNDYTVKNGDDAGCAQNETIYPGVCPTKKQDDWFYDNKVAKAVMDSMAEAKAADKLFFLAAGLRRPHRPWDVPERFYAMYKKETIPLAKRKVGPTASPELAYIHNDWPAGGYNQTKPVPDDVARYGRFGYYASVSFTDYNIGLMLNQLQALGLTSSTVVVITSDHGWHLGEQGEWCKRTNWELGVRVPLMIRSPRHPNTFGKTTDHLFEILDVYKTLNRLTHASDSVQDGVEGKDLSTLFDDLHVTPPLRKYAFSQMARCPKNDTFGPESPCNQVERQNIPYMGFSVRTIQWRYTVWLKFDGKGNRAIWPSSNDDGCFGEELYDHEHDTGVDFDAYENENIATVHPDVCKELFKVLRNEFSSAL